MLYIFDRNEELQAILSNAEKDACPYYDAEVHEVLGGEFTLSFKVPGFHEDAKAIQERFFVALKDSDGRFQLFTIQEIEDEHSGFYERTVFCEHAIVELQDVLIYDESILRQTAREALPFIMTGTQWEIGESDAGGTMHDYIIHRVSVLEALQEFVSIWGGELYYYVEVVGNRISRKVINHVWEVGANTGKRLEYSKDIETITKTVDTTEIKTALQAYGTVTGVDANGDETETEITVKVEDEEARLKYGILNSSTGVKIHRIGVHEEDEEVSGTIELETIARGVLDIVKTPKVTYSVNAVDLYSLTGLSHEQIRKGDTLAVIDRELDIQVIARVIERRIDLIFPELNDYVIGNFRPAFTQGINQRFEEARKEWRKELDRKLSRGETIKTHWLQDEIDLLQKKLLTGGGTVTMTEGDGILITDKPLDQNPTKALRLVGGIFGIANSKKPGTDQFDFRTFGTADGFTASEITSGTMKFDRARGGTLSLGGELLDETASGKKIFEHGILNVIDENGEIIVTLDGSQGGFDRLHIGHLTSNNVALRTTEDFSLFVNHTLGSAENDGTDPSKPIPTIKEALDRVPKYIEHDVRIIVDNNIYQNLLFENQSSFEASLVDTRHYSNEGVSVNGNRTTSKGAIHGTYARWVQVPAGTTQTLSYMAISTDPTRTDCRPGIWYNISSYIFQSVAKTIKVVVDFYDSTGNIIEEVESEPLTGVTAQTWSPEPLSVVAKAPVNAVTMAMDIRMYDVTEYDYFYVDALQITEGGLLRSFVPGKSYNTTGRNTITEGNIEINGFNGGGKLSIYLGEKNTIEGELQVKGCNAEIYIATKENVTLNNNDRAILYNANATGYQGIVHSLRCAYLYLHDFFIVDNAGQSAYCVMTYGSYVRILNVEGYETFNAVFCSAYGSQMYIKDCKGSSLRGVYAHGSSTIGGSGTAPVGTSANVFKAEGGGVFSTWTHDAGINPLANYEPKKTTTWTPNDYWGYNSATGWTHNVIVNGQRPTDNKAWFGVYYFNKRDFSALKNSDGTVRPIQSVRFKVRRTSYTGENVPRKPKVHSSSKETADGTAPTYNNGVRSNVGFKWGEEHWITLPVAMGEALRDGTAKSLVFYDGTESTNHSRYELEGTLEIVHG